MSEVHIEFSKGLKFAPFNGGYPDHAKHLSIARLDPQKNLWYDVYDHNDPSKTRVNWSLIDLASYEEPWFPAGVCEPAIPRTAVGSVHRVDDNSSMMSFDLNQMKAHAEELEKHALPPPAQKETKTPPPLPTPSDEVAPTNFPPSESNAPRVAVIGRGEVGITLAKRLIQAGWSVQFGSRNPTETRLKVQPDDPLASLPIFSISDVVSWSQFVLLTVPGMRTIEEYSSLVFLLGPSVEGKVVIDATNPLSSFPQLEVFWDGNQSGGEILQEILPKSFVYKAFNTVGLLHLGNPDGSSIVGRDISAGQSPLKMLYCGPSEHQAVVATIISAVGFQPLYVGSIRYSRNLEAIAELWIHLAIPGIGSTENWGMGFHFEPTGM